MDKEEFDSFDVSFNVVRNKTRYLDWIAMIVSALSYDYIGSVVPHWISEWGLN